MNSRHYDIRVELPGSRYFDLNVTASDLISARRQAEKIMNEREAFFESFVVEWRGLVAFVNREP